MHTENLKDFEQLKQDIPAGAAELDKLSTQKELDAFVDRTARTAKTDDEVQLKRHAMVRSMRSQVGGDQPALNGKHVDDQIAEALYWSQQALSKLDPVTKKLVQEHGFLGGMVEMVKRRNAIGGGNFGRLSSSGLGTTTAEYTVWKFGQQYVDQNTYQKIDNLLRSSKII